jgi:hypothetical protein
LRLKGEAKPPLKPGEPEYEEAKALELNERYRMEHTKEWRDMVTESNDAPSYSTTPAETQSRNSQNAIRDDLDGAFGETDPELSIE